MAKNKLVAPVVKWVGGKRQLLDEITPLLPKRITSYCEPFLGGGAVLFSIQPTKAIVNDLNQDLITVYEVIRDDVESLLESLKKHENTAEYFYAIRDMDRDKEVYQAMSKVERASRLIYLNKTCFNKYFASSNITFYSEDFAETLKRVRKGGFVYLDPPYDPVSDTASFTGYNKGGFDRNEQIRLKQCCDELTRRGVKFMLSNSATEFIKELYGEYEITIVKAKRAINSDASKRGAIEEVLIRNYGTE